MKLPVVIQMSASFNKKKHANYIVDASRRMRKPCLENLIMKKVCIMWNKPLTRKSLHVHLEQVILDTIYRMLIHLLFFNLKLSTF